MERIRQWGPPTLTHLVPVAVGVAWWVALGGRHTLDPTDTWWMLDGDWFCYLYAWLFHRNEPWGLPFGQVPALLHPYGVSLALTDALPLVHTVAKLFSPVLPAQFQLYGWWMCSGFIGLGLVGVRLAARFTPDRVVQGLAGALMTVSPILSQRYGHPPFYALWGLFGLLALAFAPGERWRDQRIAWALLFFCCTTNAYLAVMALAVAYAVVARAGVAGEWRGPRDWAVALLAPVGVALVGFWAFGYLASFGKVQAEAEGFGQFSADLLTLVNPTNWSRFFGGLPTGPRQYEGYAYLGLGNGLLALAGLAWALKARPSRRRLLALLPLGLVVLGFAFYSLSNVVTLLGRPVLDLREAYAKLGSLPSTFRSSGRFAWPLHGFIVVAAVAAMAHLARRHLWPARVALGLAALAQAVDLNTAASTLGHVKGRFTPFSHPAWKTVGADYRHLALIPTQISWYSPFDQEWVAKLSWEAYTQRLTINSGYIGRAPVGLVWDRHFGPGELDPKTIYVVYFREWVPDFQRQGWACGPIEGMVACVDPSRRTRFLEALEEGARTGAPYVLRPLR